MLVPAQTPPALEVNVTPAKAGTEAAPSAVSLKLSLRGPLSGQTLTVYFPQGLRISNTGLVTCDEPDARIRAGQCAGAKAGGGSLTTTEDRKLKVRAFVGARDLVFRVGADVVLHGALSQASGKYTAKMRIKLPAALRDVSALELTLKAKRGGASLFATRGCPLPFKVVLGETLTADAACS